VALVCAATLTFGQDFRATITGQVTDSSKLAIPGATVRAIRAATNESAQAITNQDGYYTLPFLDPDNYVLEVSAPGFKSLKREHVLLMVADKLALSITLEVGQVNTEITVSAAVENVGSADASGGTNFDTTQTAEYPLNGRQAYMLMELATGVQFTQEEFGATGYSGTRGWDTGDAFVMNGGTKGTNQFLMQGAPVSLKGGWQIAPNMESIREFKVMTYTYDAQYGRTGGGTVNTTIKSGTNATHGSLFDYMRNSVLDASTTQNNRIGAGRGKHITHQFGGTIGAAIRRDKDFIFVSFEGFRERVPFGLVTDTPPLDLRDGLHFNSYNLNVFDPLTVHKCAAGVDAKSCSGVYIRNPFPGDVIPASRVSPIGAKILSLYPAPNAPGQTQNFFGAGNDGQYRYDQPLGKWDHIAGEKDRFYVTFAFQHGHEFRSQNGFPVPAEYGNIISERTSQHYIADWTRVLSPASVLDVRLSFGRFTSYFPDGQRDFSFTAADLGIQMPHAATVNRNTAPRISLDQYSDVIGNNYTWGTSNQWDLAAGVTTVHGKHTTHWGGEVVYAGIGTGDIGRANGQFKFDRGWTQQFADHTGAATDGSGVASLLLGLASSGYIDSNDTYYRTAPYLASYFQDDWKIARNLTLNLGLRYDVNVPFVERWNRVNTGFDFNTVSPLSDPALANWANLKSQYDATNPKYPYPAPPAALYGGKTFIQPGGSRRTYNDDWENIQPRVGLAWAFAPKTVLRAGLGMYHRIPGQGNTTDGFNQRTNYSPSFDGNVTLANGGLSGPYSLQNPFPAGIISPSGSALGLLTNIGSSVSFDGRQLIIPRTFQYSFGIQRWLPLDMKLDLSYVGSQTVHDAMAVQLDYLSYATFVAAHATPAQYNRTVPNPFFGILPPTSDFGKGPTIAADRLSYANPLFNGVTESTNPWGKHRYDSLQVRLEKRFFGSRVSGGLMTVVSYTFSKSFDADHRLNDWNLNEAPIHELSAYDKPQNLAVSGVLDLPFGRKRKFFTGANSVVNAMISDWNYNWIVTYSSGVPTGVPNTLFACASYFAPNGAAHDEWFNTTPGCYRGRPAYSPRDTPDRFAWIRNPASPNLNMTLARAFRITERWQFHLRGESFNTTNTPQYSGPNTNYQDPRFGKLPIQQKNFPRLIQVSARITF
jgi:hypothetical protein